MNDRTINNIVVLLCCSAIIIFTALGLTIVIESKRAEDSCVGIRQEAVVLMDELRKIKSECEK